MPRPWTREGTTLVETLVALSLLALAVALTMQVLLSLARPLSVAPGPEWAAAVAALDRMRTEVASARMVLAPRRRSGACRGKVLVFVAWDGSLVGYGDTPAGIRRVAVGAEGHVSGHTLPGTRGTRTCFQYRGKTIRAVRIRLGVGRRLLLASAVCANGLEAPPAVTPPPAPTEGENLEPKLRSWLEPMALAATIEKEEE